MRRLSQYTDKDDINSFMQKEYNDLVKVVQGLKLTSTGDINLTELFPIATMLMSGTPNEAIFQAAYGVNWVLADGRNVQGTTYHKMTNLTNIPDMRGVHANVNFFIKIN